LNDRTIGKSAHRHEESHTELQNKWFPSSDERYVRRVKRLLEYEEAVTTTSRCDQDSICIKVGFQDSDDMNY
jgi:hypothetical protein